MNSSETSAKYSWPSKEQKDAIQDSGGPDEVDMLGWRGGGWGQETGRRTARASRECRNRGINAPYEGRVEEGVEAKGPVALL